MKSLQEQSRWPLIRQRGLQILQSLLRAVPSAIVVAIATFACFAFHVNFAVVSFIFLIIVVLQSLTGDFVSAVIVSVIAFLCLNYFFVPPLFSLAVSDPSDTLALVSFLITGLVVTRLIARAREAASLAAMQGAHTTRLYELAQQLLASDPNASLEEGLLKPLRLRCGHGGASSRRRLPQPFGGSNAHCVRLSKQFSRHERRSHGSAPSCRSPDYRCHWVRRIPRCRAHR